MVPVLCYKSSACFKYVDRKHLPRCRYVYNIREENAGAQATCAWDGGRLIGFEPLQLANGIALALLVLSHFRKLVALQS